MEIMLDKKQIWGIFLFEFKMRHKAAETTQNINNVFGPGTANQRTVQWWFKKFCKGDNNLEGEEHSGWPSEFDNNQLRASLKLILLKLHEKLPKNSTSTILRSFSIWSKLERWKSSISACLMKWPEIKKNCHFEVSFSLTLRNKWNISHRIVICNKKWILHDNWWRPAQWLDEKLWSISQSQTCTKKGHGHCLVLPVCSTTAFWVLVKPLHLRSMLSKSMKSAVPAAGTGQQKGPNSSPDNA